MMMFTRGGDIFKMKVLNDISHGPNDLWWYLIDAEEMPYVAIKAEYLLIEALEKLQKLVTILNKETRFRFDEKGY